MRKGGKKSYGIGRSFKADRSRIKVKCWMIFATRQER